METQQVFNYSMAVIDAYERTNKASVIREERPFQKVYSSLNTMLEECYFVGASKFGHNFIA